MKKVFTIILGLLLFSALQLNAAFLRNIKKTIIQPDGTIINCFASGDEFHNWLHDKDNYTIIQSQENGYYYYAIKEGDKIIPSEYKAGTTFMKSTNISSGINISPEQWKQKRIRKKIIFPPNFKQLKTATADVNINQICIYIRFNDDSEWVKDTAQYFDWLNDEDPLAGSMINFYKEVSYGKVEVRSHFYPHSTNANVVSYQDTKNRGYFQPYNASTNPTGYDPDEEDRSAENNSAKREWDLLERVIDYFNSNFTVPVGMDLDYDDDGYMDNIEFFIAGEAGEWDDLLWPHNWAILDRNLTIDGIKIFNYNFQIQEITDQRGVGVLSHEMGHALGYPDLYQYSEESTYDPVGVWDIMATTASVPQSFGAYTKFKYGKWIASIPEITTAGVYSLKSIDSTTNNSYKIASPYTTSEFFIVEYRKKAGRFESSLPGSGLLVYRINTAADDGNAQGPPDEVYIYRPGGTLTEDGSILNATFSANASRTSIDNTTNPSPFLNDGGVGGLYITEVSSIGENISFRVDFYPNVLYADFEVSEEVAFVWESIDFTDLSRGTPDTWEWTFEGGDPATFSGETPPSIQYSMPGTYDVSLSVTKGTETVSEIRTDYITIAKVPGTDPPRDLFALVSEANPNDVVLSWIVPAVSFQSLTLKWGDAQTNNGNGIGLGNTSPNRYTILSRWNPTDLTAYDNWYVTNINFLAFTPEKSSGYTYALKVFTGDTPIELISQAFLETSINYNHWTSVELNTPLQIDALTDLWFGVHHDSGLNNAGFLFGIDSGPAIAEKGDVLMYADGTLDYLSANALSNNWNLTATIVNTLNPAEEKSNRVTKAQDSHYKSISGYNVYRNGAKINTSVVSGTSYTDANVLDGTYSYFVTAIYPAGESLASELFNLILPDHVGIPQVEIKEVSIYPNPVKDRLYIQLEELAYDPLMIQIYDQMGKLVYSKEITPTSDTFDIAVNNLSNGAYSLLMYSTDKAFQAKFIVLN